MTKNKEVTVLSQEELAVLDESYPVSEGSSRLSLPKFGMLAKDVTKETGTGKNKKIEVIQASGTFYTEKDEGETNEEGKNVWTKNYLDGETLDVQVVYHRYQLRFYDKGLEKFISSPIYDTADQVLPLFLDKREIARGTEKELQALYPAKTAKGKPTSDLKKMTILYVIYEGEMHQFNLSVSSGWEFGKYKDKRNPSKFITTLSSTEETFGVNTFRKTLFNVARPLATQEELEEVKSFQDTVKTVVESDSRFLLASPEEKSVEEEYDKM